jgi:ribose 5-phosphate isomerase B
VKIVIGSDHAGYEIKEVIKKVLLSRRVDPVDVGTHSEKSCDYPDFGKMVAEGVSTGEFDRGILICGTGIGMSMVANRFSGVRAALCHDIYTAKMSRMHNDANVLVMGGRVIGPGLAEEIVTTWLDTAFEGGRHKGRIDKIENT